jgi:hypothetical protein
MSKANKTPDPAEAALSAIEEALNGKATGTDGPMARPIVGKVNLPKVNPPKATAAKAKLPRVDDVFVASAEPAPEVVVAAPVVEAPALAAPFEAEIPVLNYTLSRLFELENDYNTPHPLGCGVLLLGTLKSIFHCLITTR